MPYNHDTGERYSNDKHPEFPVGNNFMLNDTRYSIYRVDDIDNVITCVSKKYGFTYIKLGKLRDLLESGEAVFVPDEEE